MNTYPERSVSYDGCEPDIDGVIFYIRDGDCFRLDLDQAEKLVADLDAAIGQARRGAARLLALTDPTITDPDAHVAMKLYDPLHVLVDGVCAVCDHPATLSEPYCPGIAL